MVQSFVAGLLLAIQGIAPAVPPASTPASASAVVGPITVIAAPEDLTLAMVLAQQAERPQEWPGLGRRGPPPFRLVLARDEADLRRRSGGRAPAWGAGITLPGMRLVMLRADQDPAGTLRHELAHVVLHDAVPGRLPLWFDEGYATYASGAWDALDGLTLNFAVVRGATPSLDSLNQALRGHSAGIATAYALAASAVIDLARRNPSHSLTPLMDLLGAGIPFDEAVLRTTGLTVERFDEGWQQGLRRRYSLFTWLIAGGFWAIMALAVVAASRWRRHRDRPRRAALDQGWELPPPEEATVASSLDPTREDE